MITIIKPLTKPKQKLFLDFDGTVALSAKSFCSVYNNNYRYSEDYKYADYTLNQDWNFKDICPLVKNPLTIFESVEFFANLELFPDAYEVINKLSEKYDIYIASKGTIKNIELKMKYLKDKLPCITNYIMLVETDNVIIDKSVINCTDGIFIDDVISNLNSVKSRNCKKYIFGKEFKWNKMHPWGKTL